MALNTWEKDTLAEIKARALAKQYVSPGEKQFVLDMLVREQLPVNAKVKQRAAAEGYDVAGVLTV